MHAFTKGSAALLSIVVSACASAPTPLSPTTHTTMPVPSASVAPPAPSPSPEPLACPRAPTLDPRLIADEAACLLSEYVRIDTTNPPGNERATARFLQAVLARDGIEARIIESVPGRANLIARLPSASAGKAIALAHHMDVVPAVASEWSVPPFAAEIRDGYLWGRGSLDNKGGGLIGVLTMLMAKRLGSALPRELVVLALADEEAGSGHGSRFLVAQHPELFENIAFVLNEGGAILKVGGDRVLYSVELAQKAPLWLRVSARGPSGHGSAPSPNAAAERLVRALARLVDHRFPIVVLPEVQALFAMKAPTMPEPLRDGARDLKAALTKTKFRAAFMSDAHNAALVQNTLAITMLHGSDKENVIPAEVSAVLDVRILPGQDAQAVTREITRLLADASLEVTPLLSWQAHSSPRDTPVFQAIEAFAKAHDPGAPVVANVIAGFTDCNAFRAHKISCYGFTPLRIAVEDVARLHDKDERIDLAALGQAVVDLHALLMSMPAQ
jgi:acetylornithine deacetylase/succinyl-diaminopimelate desuccinylase-like protein